MLAAASVGVVGVAGASDSSPAPDCSTVSWTTQTVSGETYYEVDSLETLQCIESQGLDSNYILTDSIDASETATWNGGSGFDPIGDKNNEFTGTFDGNDHTISGLTIDRGGTYSVGLFSEVGSGGTITAVGLEGGSVTGARRTGQLAGFNDGTVEDSHATGEVSGTERVGGLVGRNDGTIRRSYTSGEPTRGTDWVGGLVGFNRGTVNRSFAARAVVGEGGSFDGASAGGLVGVVSTGTIEDSYATGTVTASWFVGGLLGSYQADDGGTTRRSYATGALSIGDESQGIGGIVGGSAVSDTTVENAYWDVGTTNEASVSGQSIETVTGVSGFGSTADTAPAPEMQGASAETNLPGLDFTSTWETVESEDPDAAMDGYPILRGVNRTVQLRAQGNTPDTAPTATDCAGLSWTTREISGATYHEVDSLYKLQCIEQQGLGNDYVLTGDIDAGPTAGWNGGSGFEPLGDSDTGFTGTFDGDGYTISGLTIDRPGAEEVGLFGYVGSAGTIANVTLEGGNVTGQFRVGQLVGLNYGTIKDSAATGPTNGNKYVGGLVGRNDGTIRRSSATGQSTSENSRAGGLVGQSFGTVDRSYATGDVDADTLAGGLVGHNEGTIADSYATGTVTAGYTAGGLVGKNTGADPSGIGLGTVRRSYATGTVTATEGDAEAGGLAGRNERPDGDGTIENSYWDVGTTGQERAGGDGGILTDNAGFGSVGDSTPAANATGDAVYDSMPALDFDATWTVTSDYPRLQWEGVDVLAVESLGATDPAVGENGTGSITVTATDSEGGAVEGATIEVTNADGLPGLSGEAVTDANGQATFPFTAGMPDDHAPEFAWKYDDEVGETVATPSSVTVLDAPDVDSITRTSASPTSADSVDFDVTFSESVVGVTADDFVATQAGGDVSGTVSAVTGSGSTYTVTVDSIIGDGDLRLDVTDDDSITSDGTGVELGGVGTTGAGDGGFTGGETVAIDNTAPTADAGSDRTVDEGTTVTFDASNSSDDDAIAAFEWAFGDGSANATGATPTHTYDDAGDYTVTLAVTDASGNTATETVTVAVQRDDDGAAPDDWNAIPTANADSYSLSAGARLDVATGDGLLANDSDLDGAVSDLTVSVVDGPTDGSLDLGSDGSFTYTPDDGFTGTDVFTYAVADLEGATDSATVTLVVDDGVERTVFEDPETIRRLLELPENTTPTYAERVSVTAGPSGSPSVNFTSNSTVSLVRFGPDTDARGNLTVTAFATNASLPDGVPGRVLVPLRLTGSQAVENTSATVRMRVPRAELRAAGANASAVRVAHYAGGTWELLNATVVDETDDSVTVEFTTTGFSPFAVTAVGTPEATFSALPAAVTAGDELALDASESSTPYGDLTGYEWSVAGRELSGETTTVTLDEPGEYTVALTVTNDAGRTATVRETVTVEESDPPTATATAMPTTAADTPTEATGGPTSPTSPPADGGTPAETSAIVPETTPNGSGGLGLGPAVAIVAMLALSVLAARRR
ncbi:GLUG motif-containing protein [Haloarchaeobius salinus]|uniref:GLUG motif-containing protein n=1 Tax=Haloarchaeobius salinus TaxID=1198298 RepID=UPI0026E51F35|nr:GLUG motif-containing protein [Haloarchaeobius salinus]